MDRKFLLKFFFFILKLFVFRYHAIIQVFYKISVGTFGWGMDEGKNEV